MSYGKGINYQQQTGQNSPTSGPQNLNSVTLNSMPAPTPLQLYQMMFGSGQPPQGFGGMSGGYTPPQYTPPQPIQPVPYQGISQTAGQTGAPTGQSLGGQISGTGAPAPVSQPTPLPFTGTALMSPTPAPPINPTPAPVAPQPVQDPNPIGPVPVSSPGQPPGMLPPGSITGPINFGPVQVQPIGSYLGADGQMHEFGDGYTGGAGDPGSFGPVGLNLGVSQPANWMTGGLAGPQGPVAPQ